MFIDPKGFEKYSRDDARDPWRLWWDVHKPELKKQGKAVERLFYELEMPIATVLMEMEAGGLYVDVEKMEGILREARKEIQSLEKQIYKLAGEQFNINSSEQLSPILFGKLGIKPVNIPRLAKSTPERPLYSTNKDYLKKIRKSHKIIPIVEKYRKATKMRDGFLVPFLHKATHSDTRRLYPSFNQTGTRIGRLSSENPNSQNMPRAGGIRDCIVAPEGKLMVCGDLSQIELRILAHQSQDASIIKAYREGSDLHRLVQDEVGVERTLAKNINFGILYGFAIDSLAEFIQVSRKRANEIYNEWHERFQGVPKYKEKVRWQVTKYGYVETIFGRRRRFHGLRLDAYSHRQAFHFTISGSAADVIKIGMMKLHRSLEERRKGDERYKQVFMLAQVHDEILLEAPEDIAEDVKELMQKSMEDVGGGKILVPIVAEVALGKTWSEAK